MEHRHGRLKSRNQLVFSSGAFWHQLPLLLFILTAHNLCCLYAIIDCAQCRPREIKQARQGGGLSLSQKGSGQHPHAIDRVFNHAALLPLTPSTGYSSVGRASDCRLCRHQSLVQFRVAGLCAKKMSHPSLPPRARLV